MYARISESLEAMYFFLNENKEAKTDVCTHERLPIREST